MVADRKVGRPCEDWIMRRLEIYRAVVPLLQESGAKRLSMRDAASAACLSVGGLYHYFPSKRDLVLFPLDPQVRARLCSDFHIAHCHLAESDPQAYLSAFIENVVGNIFMAKPAVLAAGDFGVDTLWDIFDQAINDVLAELVAAVKPVIPEATACELEELAKAARRVALAAIIDSTITPEEVKKEILAIIDGHRIASIRQQNRAQGRLTSSA